MVLEIRPQTKKEKKWNEWISPSRIGETSDCLQATWLVVGCGRRSFRTWEGGRKKILGNSHSRRENLPSLASWFFKIESESEVFILIEMRVENNGEKSVKWIRYFFLFLIRRCVVGLIVIQYTSACRFLSLVPYFSQTIRQSNFSSPFLETVIR